MHRYHEFFGSRGQRLSLDAANDPSKNLSRVIFDCSYIQRLVRITCDYS